MRVFRVGKRLTVQAVGSFRVRTGGVRTLWAVFVNGTRKTQEPLTLRLALKRAHEIAEDARLVGAPS